MVLFRLFWLRSDFVLVVENVLIDWKVRWKIANTSSLLPPCVATPVVDSDIEREVEETLSEQASDDYCRVDMVVSKHLELHALIKCFDAEVVRHEPKCVEGIQDEDDLQRLRPARLKFEHR